jgi:hypothetical protein
MCYHQFYGIWPKSDIPLEVVAAVLSGPVANAFVSTQRTSRHNLVSAVNEIPFPIFKDSSIQTIVNLVTLYRKLRAQWREQPERADNLEAACRQTLAQIDAEVLAAYDLPPRLEKQLLDSFSGYQRLGPVRFTGYYPPGFRPAIPWRVFISQAFRASDAHSTIARLPVLNDPVISAAVRALDDSSNDNDIDADT